MKLFKSSLVLVLASLLVVQSGGAIAQEYKPGRRGIPDKREGAGTRSPSGQCVEGPKKLMSFIPEDALGVSTTKTPALFWYVPKTIAKSAEFRLLDKANPDIEVLSTQIPLSGTPGVIAFTLPAASAAQMSVNREYYWQFSLNCSETEPSRNPFVEGTLQPVEAPTSVAEALMKAASPRDRAKVLAAAGIWQDAIATLAKHRCTNPQNEDFQAGWATLLKSVKLDDYTQEPFIQTCEAIAPDL